MTTPPINFMLSLSKMEGSEKNSRRKKKKKRGTARSTNTHWRTNTEWTTFRHERHKSQASCSYVWSSSIYLHYPKWISALAMADAALIRLIEINAASVQGFKSRSHAFRFCQIHITVLYIISCRGTGDKRNRQPFRNTVTVWQNSLYLLCSIIIE